MHTRVLALPFLLVAGMAACGSSPETTSTAAVAPEVTTTSTTPTTFAPATTSTAPPTTVRATTTARPVVATSRPAPVATTARSGCHPSYSGCVPVASDVDCAGGSGNGPAYTSAKNIRVTGPDDYGLDNDGDGLGCES